MRTSCSLSIGAVFGEWECRAAYGWSQGLSRLVWLDVCGAREGGGFRRKIRAWSGQQPVCFQPL
jgi:hypothetical protein